MIQIKFCVFKNNKILITMILTYSYQTILQNTASRHPKDYQQIMWMVDTQLQHPCTFHKGWSSEYSVCMKGELPRAMAGHFIVVMSKRWLRPTLQLYKFEKEQRSNKLTSYIATCDGDSGSGHWVTVDDTSSISLGEEGDNTRRALVAVFTKSGLTYKLPNGKSQSGPCGSIITDALTGEKRAFGPTAIKTTQSKVLNFLKKWAIKCENYDDERHVIDALYDHCATS